MKWIENLRDPSLLNRAFTPGSQSDEIVISNPLDGQQLCAITDDSAATIERVIAEAKQAQVAWAKQSAKQRGTLLRRWFDLILGAEDDLALIMTLEQGKPLAEARGEVKYGAAFVEWFSEEGKRAYGDVIPAPVNGRQLLTLKQPVGVAAAITPWNFPIAMITRKAAPALAAGCAFVCKPAVNTPLCAYAVAELAYRAGIPRELFALVCSHDAAMVGEQFCHHPDIRKLSFTGSSRVGKILMAQSASQLQRLSLELGGNAPFVVFADADIDAAVKGAMESKFRNAGQTCVCANRFYVARTVHDEFVSKFVAEVSKLKVGNGLDAGVEIGPLIDEAALIKVGAMVEQAVTVGAQIVCGGKRHGEIKSCFMPTVLVDVDHSNPILHEEIFGPVAPICVFDTVDELIAICNDTPYGLASYFYSRDVGTIWQVATALEYGMVGINEGIISTEVAPFGGVKQSGLGREGSHQGLDEYMEIKYLCMGSLH
ncbi:NAD-dependent succinate-semialdehyde dehydrogenase [Corallincola spongiicola]|uniref:NAD-dependent succinate-semialdehyde dehydrogenase n=1 Tax=Corallincola spongiicola TaxID=2520508 RepID=A0ABY1WPU2_9GAMM|nr:NAD-dependent succinate-semialdehyde dehydrogenase [Corallincola spongiicola]TAA45972.1 NAD-dependent succinate-semialdehyde dehydrogenase [Corallincola spongiicola]